MAPKFFSKLYKYGNVISSLPTCTLLWHNKTLTALAVHNMTNNHGNVCRDPYGHFLHVGAALDLSVAMVTFLLSANSTRIRMSSRCVNSL